MCTSYKQEEINIIFWKENLLSSHLQVNAIGVTNGGGRKSSRKSAPKLSLNRLGLIQLLKAFPALCKPAIGKSCPLPGHQPPHMQLCFHSLCLASNLNQNQSLAHKGLDQRASASLRFVSRFQCARVSPSQCQLFQTSSNCCFLSCLCPSVVPGCHGRCTARPNR